VAHGAPARERLVGELVAWVDGRHPLGPDLELEAEQLRKGAGLAPLRLAQPGPGLLVDVVGQHHRLLHEEAPDTVAWAGAGYGLGGEADELVGVLDLPQRHRQQVAHDVAAHEEQGLGPGIVGEGTDAAVVLGEHPPGDELPKCGDQSPPVGVAVVGQVDTGLRRGGTYRLGEGGQQHLLATGEQYRAAQGQVGVGAR